MALNNAEVTRLSNLTDWKLKDYIKTFKHKAIVIREIIAKATALKRDAMIRKDVLLTNKLDDLIENVSEMQRDIEAAQD